MKSEVLSWKNFWLEQQIIKLKTWQFLKMRPAEPIVIELNLLKVAL